MFITFKNQHYNLAITASAIKEIIAAQELVRVPNQPNIVGMFNFRDHIIPISLLENHQPSKGGLFIIVKNDKGLGGLWVDEVETMINKDIVLESINVSEKPYEVLKVKDKLYCVVNPQDIFTQEVAS